MITRLTGRASSRSKLNLVDFSDTQNLVACRHCAELLQDGDRFCRFCGQDQWDGDVIDVSIAGSSESLLPMPAKSAVAGVSTTRTLAMATRRQASERPAPEADVPEMWERGARSGNPVMMGIAMILMLLFGAVLVYDLYTDRKRDAERLEQLGAQVEQMQQALDQGELGAVERLLRGLGEDASADPRVTALKSALRRQQAAMRSTAQETQEAKAAQEVREPEAPAVVPGPPARPAPALAATTPAPVPAPSPAPAPASASASAPEPAPSLVAEPAPSSTPAPIAVQRVAPEPANPAPSDPGPSLGAATTATAAEQTPGAAASDGTVPASSPGCSEALAAMALCPQP